jgi:hypothetical protein
MNLDECTSDYVGVLVKGNKHWLWFRKEYVSCGTTTFSGKNGWGGKNGRSTIHYFECDAYDIKAYMFSDRMDA